MFYFGGWRAKSQVQNLPTDTTDTTGVNKLTTTDTVDTTDISTDGKRYDADHLFAALPDLVNPTFRAWYCKRFYTLGRDKVLVLASTARADAKTDKRRYFSKLLKEAA